MSIFLKLKGYETTVNLENLKFYKNLSSGFKIIRLSV